MDDHSNEDLEKGRSGPIPFPVPTIPVLPALGVSPERSFDPGMHSLPYAFFSNTSNAGFNGDDGKALFDSSVREAEPTRESSQFNSGQGYGDPSAKVWGIYVAKADKHDKMRAESWNGDTQGILVFTGLFSATVAAFLIESYKLLIPDPEDRIVSLLGQISQQLAANSSTTGITSTSSGTPFRQTSSSIRINILWFMSLALSITCALIATLMQTWVRRYIQVTQQNNASVQKQARIRSYFYHGVEKFGLPTAVGVIPALLHISVFLFFAGLAEFVFNLSDTVGSILVSYFAVCAFAYLALSMLPLFISNCPYHTPLTSFFWFLYHLLWLTFMWPLKKIFLQDLTRGTHRLRNFAHGAKVRPFASKIVDVCVFHMISLQIGMVRYLERRAGYLGALFDRDALRWTIENLDEDDEFEQFVDGISGFYRSRSVRRAKIVIEYCSKVSFMNPWLGHRILLLTQTAQAMSNAAQLRRFTTCIRAICCLPWVLLDFFPTKIGDDASPQLEAFHMVEAWQITDAFKDDNDQDLVCTAYALGAWYTYYWKKGVLSFPETAVHRLLERQFRVDIHGLQPHLEDEQSFHLTNTLSLVRCVLPHMCSTDPDDDTMLYPFICRVALLISRDIRLADMTEAHRQEFRAICETIEEAVSSPIPLLPELTQMHALLLPFCSAPSESAEQHDGGDSGGAQDHSESDGAKSLPPPDSVGPGAEALHRWVHSLEE
ncbi:hypothetical protein BC834DRAFT_901524 [Gloeopeniophorella convolvens]|nr:hypothetical protein BC834DRAFT_901524 [Gloeopeniophorella convolvens]